MAKLSVNNEKINDPIRLKLMINFTQTCVISYTPHHTSLLFNCPPSFLLLRDTNSMNYTIKYDFLRHFFWLLDVEGETVFSLPTYKRSERVKEQVHFQAVSQVNHKHLCTNEQKSKNSFPSYHS